MAINPKYAQLAANRGEDEKNLPVFSWGTVGSEIKGTITYVGDFFEKDNSKFYTPEKTLFDENGNKVVQPAKGTPTVTTQKVIIQKPDGEKVAIYFQKKGQWDAIFKGLEAAGLDDLAVGVKFRGVRVDDNDKAHAFDFAFKA